MFEIVQVFVCVLHFLMRELIVQFDGSGVDLSAARHIVFSFKKLHGHHIVFNL